MALLPGILIEKMTKSKPCDHAIGMKYDGIVFASYLSDEDSIKHYSNYFPLMYCSHCGKKNKVTHKIAAGIWKD